MSYRITINSWSGDDQNLAAEQISKLFRMEMDKAVNIVDDINGGTAWKFGQQISDRDGKVAKKYLTDLGFDVELTPAVKDPGLGLGVNPYADDEDYEEPPKKMGFFAKLKEKLSKKK